MLPGRGASSLCPHTDAGEGPGPAVTKQFSLSHPVTNRIRQAASDTECPVHAYDFAPQLTGRPPVQCCSFINDGNDDYT